MGVAGRPVTSPLWFIARGGEGLSQGDYVKLAAEVAQVCSAKIAARVGEEEEVRRKASHRITDAITADITSKCLNIIALTVLSPRWCTGRRMSVP